MILLPVAFVPSFGSKRSSLGHTLWHNILCTHDDSTWRIIGLRKKGLTPRVRSHVLPQCTANLSKLRFLSHTTAQTTRDPWVVITLITNEEYILTTSSWCCRDNERTCVGSSSSWCFVLGGKMFMPTAFWSRRECWDSKCDRNNTRFPCYKS